MYDAEHNSNSLGHETLETDVRTVWRTAAVIVGVVIGAYAVILGMMNWFATSDGRPPANQQAQTEPAWNEQTPLQRLRTREQNWLSQYDWVDRDAGVARIPVDRAVEIVAKNGLPTTLSAPDSAKSAQQSNVDATNRTTTSNNQQ